MSKRNPLSFSIFFILSMAIIFMFLTLYSNTALYAQQNTSTNEVDMMTNNEQPQNIPSDTHNNGPRVNRHGRKMNPPAPPVMYIGYAVKSETEFETACANFISLNNRAGNKNKNESENNDENNASVENNTNSNQKSKLKKPVGTIEIEKNKYYIVEADIEKQPASNQLFPEEAKAAGIKPPFIIKSCKAKISSSYFEMPAEPPAPGESDKMEMPEGKANIVGDIILNSVEKEAPQNKLILFNGTVTVNGEKYSLYLEPRIINHEHRQKKGAGKPEMNRQ